MALEARFKDEAPAVTFIVYATGAGKCKMHPMTLLPMHAQGPLSRSDGSNGVVIVLKTEL